MEPAAVTVKKAPKVIDEEEEKLWGSMSLVKEGKKLKRTSNNDDIKVAKKRKSKEM